MAKRKSINDIIAQVDRINALVRENPRLQGDGSRMWRVAKAAETYANNIGKKKSYQAARTDDMADSRKFSQRTYMGLSAG